MHFSFTEEARNENTWMEIKIETMEKERKHTQTELEREESKEETTNNRVQRDIYCDARTQTRNELSDVLTDDNRLFPFLGALLQYLNRRGTSL